MERIQLHKAADIKKPDGNDIILRHRTLSGDLWLEVKVAKRDAIGGGGFKTTQWRVVLSGRDMMTRWEVMLIEHALVLPFVVADILELLQALPADVMLGDRLRWKGVPLGVMYMAYNCEGLGPITKRHLAHRVMNYPRKLTEVADGAHPAA